MESSTLTEGQWRRSENLRYPSHSGLEVLPPAVVDRGCSKLWSRVSQALSMLQVRLGIPTASAFKDLLQSLEYADTSERGNFISQHICKERPLYMHCLRRLICSLEMLCFCRVTVSFRRNFFPALASCQQAKRCSYQSRGSAEHLCPFRKPAPSRWKWCTVPLGTSDSLGKHAIWVITAAGQEGAGKQEHCSLAVSLKRAVCCSFDSCSESVTALPPSAVPSTVCPSRHPHHPAPASAFLEGPGMAATTF